MAMINNSTEEHEYIRGENMNKNKIGAGILLIGYIIFLVLYLQEVISELIFLFLLLVSLIVTGGILIVCRKKQIPNLKVLFSALLIMLILFCYELPLFLFAFLSPSHIAYAYRDPTEVVEGTSIYSLSVAAFELHDIKSKKKVEDLLVKQNVDVLSVMEIDNQIVYRNKNEQILRWLHLLKTAKKQSEENVLKYLGSEEEWIRNHFKDEQQSGDSAGLILAVTGLLLRGEFENNVPIAVTGAINAKGEVLGVGVLREKIQITDESGIKFMIIPNENEIEARKIQQGLNTNIEIYSVATVDEAVQLIQNLNEKH